MGASVPADGALLSAQARVSEAMMTGESSGVLKQAGEKLWAGSLNQGAALELQVQKVGPDTRYAQIMTLMREAMSLMKRHDLKSLVVEQQTPQDAWGLITYTNVLKTIVAEAGDIDLVNVYDVCARPAISVGESLDVRHVASLMTQNGIKRLLVLRDNASDTPATTTVATTVAPSTSTSTTSTTSTTVVRTTTSAANTSSSAGP